MLKWEIEWVSKIVWGFSKILWGLTLGAVSIPFA